MKGVHRFCKKLLYGLTVAALVLVCCRQTVLAEKLNIVTTTTDLAAIATEIAGDHGIVRSLCSGKEDRFWRNYPEKED